MDRLQGVFAHRCGGCLNVIVGPEALTWGGHGGNADDTGRDRRLRLLGQPVLDVFGSDFVCDCLLVEAADGRTRGCVPLARAR